MVPLPGDVYGPAQPGSADAAAPGHLTEEQLNRYLDGEMSDVELAAAGTHLTACGACRDSLGRLRRLFAALDELAPVPDLVAALRPRLGAARAAAGWRWPQWLGQALGTAAVVAAAAWAALRPAGYWPAALDRVEWLLGSWLAAGSAAVAGLPGDPARWVGDLPQRASAWPGAALGALQRWAAETPGWSDLRLSGVQLGLLGVALVGLGLAGNWVLLRRAALNGR